METELSEIKVTLSRDQKEKIFHAYFNRKKITLYLNNDALRGDDTLLVPEMSIKWDIDHFVSDKETFPESFVWHYDHYMLDKETFSEMLDNGFMLIPSMNDEGLKNFRLYTPPTVVERLEEARKQSIPCFKMFLNYSLLTDSHFTTKYSVFKNIGKMMEKYENVKSIFEKS